VRVSFNETTTYQTTTETGEKKSRTEYRRNSLWIMSNVRLSTLIHKTVASNLYSHDNSMAPDLLRHGVATHSEHNRGICKMCSQIMELCQSRALNVREMCRMLCIRLDVRWEERFSAWIWSAGECRSIKFFGVVTRGREKTWKIKKQILSHHKLEKYMFINRYAHQISESHTIF